MLAVLLIATSLLAAGDHAVEAGEIEAAIKAYRAHLEVEPDSYRARLGLARATAFSGRWPEAVDLYTALLDENPNDPDARLGRGRVFSWMGAWPRAEEDLRAVTQSYPHYGDAWYALGDLLLWTDRVDESIEAYSRWVALEPHNPDAWLARFRAQRAARHFSEARADLGEAEAAGAPPDVVAEGRTSLDRLAWQGWEVAFRYDFVAFAEPRDDWHTARASVQRDFDLGSLTVDTTFARRFDAEDEAIGLEGYVDLWERAYTNVRAQVGLDAQVLPELDARLSLHQGFAEIWEASLSYRNLRFVGDRANVFGAWIAVNVGDWYFRQQTLLVPKGGEVGFVFDGLARFAFATVDDRVELQVGGGRDVVTLTGQRVEPRRTLFARLELQRFFERRVGLIAAFSVLSDEAVPTGWGASLGLAFRWE